MGKKKDLTGLRFGRLVVIEPTEKRCQNGNIIWLCKCDCGNIAQVASKNLLSGNTKSCNCLAQERKKRAKRGACHTRLHKIWENMIERCNNPNADNYRWYGGKGVKVCKEWAESFEAFEKWAYANGYKELTIDRIDADKDYCPENCQWLTLSENVAKMWADRRAKKEAQK